MSNTDGFIEEVTEEVRKDQLFGMYKKYGWIAVLAVVGLVVGTGVVEYRKSATASAAQSRGDAIIMALNNDDAVARSEALATIADAGGSEAAVAQLHRAGVLMEQDDVDGALAIYDTLKSGTGIYAQVATLKAIMTRGADMDMDQRMLELDALSVAGNPFRTVALEQKAIALIDDGKTDEAVAGLISLLDEAGVSQAMQSRTQQLILALGGEVPVSPRIVGEGATTQ